VTGEVFGDDRFCFVCGAENPDGLGLSPRGEDGRGFIGWTPSRRFQGFAGILHGGIVSALMDEAMAYAAMSVSGSDAAATATIAVSLHRPVSTDRPLTVEARVVEHRGRIIRTEASMLQGGDVMASATASFLAVPSSGG
jgi:uncharacterized protein (TIGR00369 family)